MARACSQRPDGGRARRNDVTDVMPDVGKRRVLLLDNKSRTQDIGVDGCYDIVCSFHSRVLTVRRVKGVSQVRDMIIRESRSEIRAHSIIFYLASVTHCLCPEF